MSVQLSVVMPVRNEGPNLKRMLKILMATLEVSHEILVVYDFKGDNSVPVLRKMKPHYKQLKPVHNTLGKGVANAITSGVRSASGKYILIIAADDVGPVLAVEEMMTLLNKGYDLVSATRYAKGGRIFGGHFMSRFLSRIANKMFYYFAGSDLTDSTIGIKMFRKSIYDQIVLESRPVGWVVMFEFSIKAQLAGLKLGEVPIISINRFYGGQSSFNLTPWVREYFRWFLWGVKRLRFSRGGL